MFGIVPTRVYTVHVPGAAGRSVEEAVFVREGFAWGAFLFSALWALAHRMWFAALIMLAVVVGAAYVSEYVDLDDRLQVALVILLAVYFGLEANDWYRAALARRGFHEVGVVVASSLTEAEHRWFARHFAHPHGPPT
jgi:hypothetical protein